MTLREWIQQNGTVIIRSGVARKPGDIIRGVKDLVADEELVHPFVVLRRATRQEYLAQGKVVRRGLGKDTYFYEVVTD